MNTLLTLFGKERSELQKEIDRATSVEQVVKLVHSRLDTLQKSYIGELNVNQVRLASFFLDTLRQSVATLTAANETQLALPEPDRIVNQGGRLSPNRLILKAVQGLISIAILGSLVSLTRTSPGAWMAILLVGVLLGVEVVLQLDKDKNKDSAELPQLPEAPQPIVRVDSQVLLDNIADALNTIDLAVGRSQDAKKPLDDLGIEELPELLNLIQRLMGASYLERPQMALELARLLPQTLMEQGIRVQIYRPEDAQNGREYFDFEPSIDRTTKDYITITPALLKGDRLLRRGRVIEPAFSQARDS
ncbi:hypothetical protein [Aerosakkonema funiforme]|uniref:hypothetical protein n=1 Tax=Aerosakkonema funiforme TaxID=1246630 RepID=UPI0035BB13EA